MIEVRNLEFCYHGQIIVIEHAEVELGDPSDPMDHDEVEIWRASIDGTPCTDTQRSDLWNTWRVTEEILNTAKYQVDNQVADCLIFNSQWEGI